MHATHLSETSGSPWSAVIRSCPFAARMHGCANFKAYLSLYRVLSKYRRKVERALVVVQATAVYMRREYIVSHGNSPTV